MSEPARDEYGTLIKTLWDLDQGLADMAIDIMEIRSRIHAVTEAYQKGVPLRDTFPDNRSVLVRKLTDLSLTLDRYGGRVRRQMVCQLVREGVSASDIAKIFGVTRQRVSKLLQDAKDPSK